MANRTGAEVSRAAVPFGSFPLLVTSDADSRFAAAEPKIVSGAVDLSYTGKPWTAERTRADRPTPPLPRTLVRPRGRVAADECGRTRFRGGPASFASSATRFEDAHHCIRAALDRFARATAHVDGARARAGYGQVCVAWTAARFDGESARVRGVVVRFARLPARLRSASARVHGARGRRACRRIRPDRAPDCFACALACVRSGAAALR
jgi:hypothetical protein